MSQHRLIEESSGFGLAELASGLKPFRVAEKLVRVGKAGVDFRVSIGSRSPVKVTTTLVRRGFGLERMLICRDCRGSVRRLYVARKGPSCRVCLGLAYQSQSLSRTARQQARALRLADRLTGEGCPRSRGKNRRRIEAELRVLADTLELELQPLLIVAGVIAAEDQKRRRNQRIRRRAGESSLTTRSALYEGRRRSAESTSDLEIEAQRTAARSVQVRTPTRPYPKGLLPRLDVRALKQRQGFSRAQRLVWLDDRGHLACEAVSVHRGDHILLLVRSANGPFRRQRINLSVGRKRNELNFICPARGSRHRHMYFRGSAFASAAAQKAV